MLSSPPFFEWSVITCLARAYVWDTQPCLSTVGGRGSARWWCKPESYITIGSQSSLIEADGRVPSLDMQPQLLQSTMEEAADERRRRAAIEAIGYQRRPLAAKNVATNATKLRGRTQKQHKKLKGRWRGAVTRPRHARRQHQHALTPNMPSVHGSTRKSRTRAQPLCTPPPAPPCGACTCVTEWVVSCWRLT